MDWDACKVEVARRAECKNSSLSGWEAVQGSDLRKRYEHAPEKFEKLIAKRREQNLFYEDPDFPGDPDAARLCNLYFSFLIFL